MSPQELSMARAALTHRAHLTRDRRMPAPQRGAWPLARMVLSARYTDPNGKENEMATYNPTNTGTGAGIGSETGRTYGNEDVSRGGGMEGRAAGMEGEEGKPGAGVTGAIGTRLERAGDYLDEKGKAQFISDRLHNAGRYLQEHDVRSITKSVDAAICAHPYRSMLVGLGIGWALGKMMSR